MHIKTTIEEVKAYRNEMHARSMALIEKKGADYNRDQQRDGDTLFNLSVCELLGIVPTTERGILVRLADKFMRLVSLMDVGREAAVADEKIENTIEDIHNYIDYAGLIRRKRIIAMCGEATDSPANADAVPREVAEEVRCFEWLGARASGYAAILRFSATESTAIRYDGSEHADQSSAESISAQVGYWREFPPTEWPAKVAAVKAAAQAAQPAGEWPKWTLHKDYQHVRVHGTSGNYVWNTYVDPRAWTTTTFTHNDRTLITRAQAVELIGESAVCEGERLANS